MKSTRVTTIVNGKLYFFVNELFPVTKDQA
jgi:hypothetical protein